MTRLTSGQVASIPENLTMRDQNLQEKTDCSLAEIGVRAANLWLQVRGARDLKGNFISHAEKKGQREVRETMIVPITAGGGEIAGFSQAVKSIVEHMGFSASISSSSDVEGLEKGLCQEVEAIFMADDNSFIAYNPNKNILINNDEATASAYVEALSAMSGGLEGREVLLIGCGNVGREAARFLLAKKAKPICFDINRKPLENISKLDTRIKMAMEVDKMVKGDNEGVFEKVLRKNDLIMEATPAADLITEKMMGEQTRIAAAGVPTIFTDRAARLRGEDIIHDILELGVSVMTAAVLG